MRDRLISRMASVRYQWKSMPLGVEFAIAGLELDAFDAGVGIGFGPHPSAEHALAAVQRGLGDAAGQNTPAR